MGRIGKVGIQQVATIWVYQTDGITPQTGLTNSSFTTKKLLQNGAAPAGSPTGLVVTEIDSSAYPGAYKVTFTPDQAGHWEWRVAVPTYADAGVIDDVDITADGILTLAAIQAYLDANSTQLALAISDLATVLTDLTTLTTDVAALPSASSIVTALMATSIESGVSLLQALRLIGAGTVGLSSGDPGSPTFKGLDKSTTRIAASVDSNGNRTGLTYTP